MACTPPKVCIGWKGYMMLGTAVMPYLTVDVSEKINHIPSDDVHGGGVGTTHGAYHSQINAAEGQITFDGRVTGNVYVGTGGFGIGFRKFLEKTIGESGTDTTDRECGFDASSPLILSVGGCGLDGAKAMRFPAASFGRAVVASMTLNGNLGGLVGWEAEIQASSLGDTSTTPAFPGGFTFESGASLGAGSPVPYFESGFAFGAGGLGETGVSDLITGWTMNINNNTQPVWTFNGERSPRDIYQGQMEITGNFTYYSDDGDFARLKNGSTLTITFGDSLGAGALKLFSPYLALDPRPITSGGVNEITSREVNFRCLGAAIGGSLFIL